MNVRALLVRLGAFVALLALGFLVQADRAEAERIVSPVLSQATCTANGGSWSGISAIEGTCTYAANSFYATINCGVDHTYFVTYGNDQDPEASCVYVEPDVEVEVVVPKEPPPDYGQKCKLIQIDRVLKVGGTFNANWIGLMNSIRFRQPGAGLQFISMIPGTLTYEQVHPDHDHKHRAGDFENGFLLDRGRWQASCWGPEGTFGTPIIVHVK